jgi:hypothetical protein
MRQDDASAGDSMNGMELIDFHKMRTGVQDNAWPAGDEEVLAAERKLWSALVRTGIFADVEVDRTDDPDRLVIAMCRFPFQLSAEVAAEALERLWLDRLRYEFWEAHALIVTRDQVELEAASRSGSGGHFVTLHVVAQQSPFPAQRTPYPSERPTAAPAR